MLLLRGRKRAALQEISRHGQHHRQDQRPRQRSHRQREAGRRQSRRLRKLQVEGGIQELKGEGQVAVGKAKAAIKEGAQKLADEANDKL